MKIPSSIAMAAILAISTPLSKSAPVDRATITEAINSVSVINASTQKAIPAKKEQLFTAPNILRTGENSRAELVAPDQTVTRVGQNTLFSFNKDSREIDLQRGSLLFNSPSGKGGGTIRTPSASAAVLGTTLIVVTTKNGGFKILLIEGQGRVKANDGTTRILNAGEMVFAMPGGKLSAVFEFRLSQQVGASNLIRGFKTKLPSEKKISAAINKQEKAIASGTATATNLLASGAPNLAYQVDVARETQVTTTTTSETETQSPFQLALGSDAIVLFPDLDPARIFTDQGPNFTEFANSARPFLFGEPGKDGADIFPAENPAQFIGRNILFSSDKVDLSLFSSHDVIQFLAVENILLDGSLDFGSTSAQLQLLSGGTLRAKPGSRISAIAPQFALLTLGSQFPDDGLGSDPASSVSTKIPFELSDIEIHNGGGSLQILGGSVTLSGIKATSTGITHISASRDLKIEIAENSISDFTIGEQNISVPSGYTIISGDKGARVTAGDDISARGVGIGAPRILIESEGNLRLTEVRISDFSNGITESQGGTTSGVPATTIIRAPNLVDLRGVNFISSDVLVQARTIALRDVRFAPGSRVILESELGRIAPAPNTGAPVLPGFVNFVENVRYGSTNAGQAVIQNGPGTTPSGPGIIVRPKRN